MKLLVPLDGTRRSEEILPWARAFLAHPRMRVELLHVAEQRSDDDHGCRDYVLRAARSLASDRVRGVADEGDPARQILRHAAAHRCDLIAMKSRVRRGLARLLFGSVAEEVLWKSEIPVFMLGPSAARASSTPRLQRVLVALDATPRSTRILDVVARLQPALDLRVTLLHVLQGPLRSRFFAGWAKELSSRGLAADGDLRLAFGGDVAARILEAVESSGCDFVAMTPRSRSAVARVLLGSVAERVLERSPVPVLLDRSAGDAR